MTHLHVSYDLLACVTRVSFICVWRQTLTFVTWLVCMHDMTLQGVIHTCDMTRAYVWHDLFRCVLWPLQMCDISYSYMRRETIIRTGNNIDGDGCNAICRIEECGNGVVDFGEECDDGNDDTCDGCSECRIEVCGDRLVCASQNEACDDGICLRACACLYVRVIWDIAHSDPCMCTTWLTCAQMGFESVQCVASAPPTGWRRCSG